MTTDPSAASVDDRFSHEALFYTDQESFLEGALPFIREGLALDEAVLVAVPTERLELLRRELHNQAKGVAFADMTELGRNPARIISAWRDFLAERKVDGARVRGIGEPIWAGRTSEEMVECQRHESLLNLAFDGSGAWRLLCPYDLEKLDPGVVAEAQRSHPVVWENGRRRESAAYVEPELRFAGCDEDLPQLPGRHDTLAFTRDDLSALRALVSSRARAAGFGDRRVADVVLAANEVATNSVVHGGGEGTLAVWQRPDSLVCEVRDAGHIANPLVGRERPSAEAFGGRGMWLLNQLCDLVEVRTLLSGSVVRFRLVGS